MMPTTAYAQKIYSCVTAQGQRLTADRPIPECTDREQRVHGADGSARSVIRPSMSAQERAQFEERERQMQRTEAAKADAARRDRNLLMRYPDEAAHQRGREAAVQDLQRAITTSERRLAEAEKERIPLQNEAGFYQGKPLPAPLRKRFDSLDATVEAHKGLIQNQQAEMRRVNEAFDAELARLKRLWAGVAPGSGEWAASSLQVPATSGSRETGSPVQRP